MNLLHVGFAKRIEPPRAGLLIDDEVADIPRSRVFDPLKHCFNPLKNIDYKNARQLADVLYTISPEGESTLTVRNGKRALLKGLLQADRFDRIRGDEEVGAMMSDILVSPVLRRVLCEPTNFSFNPRSLIQARINRAEIGEFDAPVLGLLLINHFQGQLIIPDFGFYGRDVHASLVRENRLVAGVNFLGELSPRLRRSALLIHDKVAQGAIVEDAQTLAEYSGLVRGTNGFNSFVDAAVAQSL